LVQNSSRAVIFTSRSLDTTWPQLNHTRSMSRSDLKLQHDPALAVLPIMQRKYSNVAIIFLILFVYKCRDSEVVQLPAPFYTIYWHFIPLRPKYSFHRPVLKHPQYMIFLSCERLNFTPLQNCSGILNTWLYRTYTHRPIVFCEGVSHGSASNRTLVIFQTKPK
jgi:hypothetical protein